MDIELRVKSFVDNVAAIKREIGKAVVGHHEVVHQTLISIVAGWHALLEGVPGIGKTLLVRTISRCMNLKFSRIQFTPDLMPADIIGTNIIVEDERGNRSFRFQHGPIFGNIILADEINRATPKTQSALLEAMQEKSVTVGGTHYLLEEPFFVLATQNPIEMEGTYPLPEAQLDRFFFKIELRPSDVGELVEVIAKTTGRENPEPAAILSGKDLLAMRELSREVPIATPVAEYAARIVLATHPESPRACPMAKKYLRYGASPRGAQAMVLAGKISALIKGRYNVSFNDIREAALPSLAHRVILNFEAEAEGIKARDLIARVIEETPETMG